ncbi:MAG: cation:proton antiporter [Bacteroidales bacterium]|nr:cation:proton antiporter [Bacteroidales bacterium]MCF8345220.1 cation:proton antiporter [Bacteroidales bacterium]MCF8351179.1 cation:proton antiporter [Bacteroidales bacterium]
MSEHVLVEIGAIVLLGIMSQWVAWRLRFPSIFLLLIAGFVAGPVTGLIEPDLLMGEMLMPFVSLSVAIILFEGGLTLNVKELREIGGVVLSLVILGVLVTWTIGTLTAHYLLNINFEVSILLAAILTVTGPTVIGPLLRQIKPSGKVNQILKWEGIVIDPIGALLAVLVFEGIIASGLQGATTAVLISLGKTILFGTLSGVVFAFLLVLFLRKFWIPDYLQESMTLSMVIASFLVSDILQPESGLFAATLMGIVIANQKYVGIKHILEFKENLRVLIISILFIILSARLKFDVFQDISFKVLILLAVLIFVARPLSVFLSSVFSSLNIKEKVFLSWMAPRGIVAAAVSSLFALKMLEIGIEQADLLVPITFIVIVGTVAIYGLTAGPLARGLKLSQSNPQGILFLGAHPVIQEIAQAIMKQGFKVVMVDRNRNAIAEANMKDIPAVYGNMLSEQVFEEIPFEGIGKLMAVTPNEEANSLALFHFDQIFDREETFQISRKPSKKSGSRDILPNHLKGRILFGDDVDLSHLIRMYNDGAVIKATHLTDDFDYQSFKEFYGKDMVPLFSITKEKKLLVHTSDNKFEPLPGHTIIALVKETD